MTKEQIENAAENIAQKLYDYVKQGRGPEDGRYEEGYLDAIEVQTRDKRPVRIICFDRQCELEYNYPIIALVSVENTEAPIFCNKKGKTWNNNEVNDLFFADEEENTLIEIPFGAKDSELGGFDYTIPEGYTARIENGHIIVEKVKEELTEFEEELEMIMVLFSNSNIGSDIRMNIPKQKLHDYAARLLELAEKRSGGFSVAQSEGYADGFKKGKEDALKDLPKLTKIEPSEGVLYIGVNGWFITVEDFEKLPKEE